MILRIRNNIYRTEIRNLPCSSSCTVCVFISSVTVNAHAYIKWRTSTTDSAWNESKPSLGLDSKPTNDTEEWIDNKCPIVRFPLAAIDELKFDLVPPSPFRSDLSSVRCDDHLESGDWRSRTFWLTQIRSMSFCGQHDNESYSHLA